MMGLVVGMTWTAGDNGEITGSRDDRDGASSRGNGVGGDGKDSR